MIETALLMGLVGSLHCSVMCGPLVLAIPAVNQSGASRISSRFVYHLGRISVYALLGLLFGAIGKTLLLAGFQRWLSITAGIALLVFLILGHNGVHGPFWKASIWVKSLFRNFLQRRSYLAVFILGAANGLLPCGLVYMAGTASAASGDILQSSAYMVVFGLGTVPMMLAITFSGARITRFLQGFRFKAVVPAAVTLVAFMLILRGLALDIPYLSPAMAGAEIACPSCERE